jgi:hypothetical protein
MQSFDQHLAELYKAGTQPETICSFHTRGEIDPTADPRAYPATAPVRIE